MNAPAAPRPRRSSEIAALLARWLLGGLFIYLGVSKVLHGAEFLTFVRHQLMITNPFLSGLIATVGPALEVFYGLLLMTGIARDAAAVVGRWWLGAVFIYMGLNKALPHPEAFLKLVREYHMVTNPALLELDWRRAALVRGVLRSAAPGRRSRPRHCAEPHGHAGALQSGCAQAGPGDHRRQRACPSAR